jgi:hypothetical protein
MIGSVIARYSRDSSTVRNGWLGERRNPFLHLVSYERLGWIDGPN